MRLDSGKLPEAIGKALTEWENNYMGCATEAVNAEIIRDMVIVSLKGVLSAAERRLAGDYEGMLLVKKLRQQLVEQGRAELEEILFGLTAVRVISIHTDISTRTGERLFVFRMEQVLTGHQPGYLPGKS
jgi:uncharacterized protein YbcI